MGDCSTFRTKSSDHSEFKLWLLGQNLVDSWLLTLLMSSFTFDICIMWNVYLHENLSYMYPFYIYLKKIQRNACNACALTIYGHGTTFFERFITPIQVTILPPIGVALPSVGVTVTLHENTARVFEYTPRGAWCSWQLEHP